MNKVPLKTMSETVFENNETVGETVGETVQKKDNKNRIQDAKRKTKHEN